MAKKSLVRRNKVRQSLSNLHRSKRDALKKIYHNENLSLQERIIAQTKLSELPRDGSISRYRNRCALSGRPRGNLRKFNLSRIAVRHLGLFGLIPGLRKSNY